MKTVAERIADLTEVNDATGCWEWLARRDRDGYGRIKVAGRPRAAHRVAYETHVGPIPNGLQIDHLCRVRHCVNPAHLEPVTSGENTRRAPHVIGPRCRRGHLRTPATDYRAPSGRRSCRVCHREASARHRARAASA